MTERKVVVFAYDFEAGGPNTTANPVVAIGWATVVITIGGERSSCATIELESSGKACCWDGTYDGFDPKTREWWATQNIEQFRSDKTCAHAFGEFVAAFRAAHTHSIKINSEEFYPTTDCAAYDTAWFSALSSRHYPAARPMPMWLDGLMLETIDVAAVTAGFVAAYDSGFCPAHHSTSVRFQALLDGCLRHQKQVNKPAWVVGNTHDPEQDARFIAFRFAQVLNAQWWNQFAAPVHP